MSNLQETFSTDSLTIAVVFVDEAEHSHLTPTCEHVQGATRVAEKMEDRGKFVCGCIPVPVPISERLKGPSTDAPVSSGNTEPTKSERLDWPADLPQANLSTAADVEAWLATVPRKLTPEDVHAIPSLKTWATEYVMQPANQTLKNGEPNEFITSVADACARYSITAGQAKGVINWWKAQVTFGNKSHSSDLKVSQSTVDLRVDSISSGMYAVPNGETRLKLRINKPTKGKWAGYVFVDDGAAYGQQKRYGMQRPTDATYSGQVMDALAAIVKDPIAAMGEYGRLTGTCGACNRALEDELSVERGIGPVCWSKLTG